jgi:proteasome lid subunit RPN8/RPN11
MTLHISQAVFEQIREHLETGYPNEACGALIGRPGGAHAPSLGSEFRGMRNTNVEQPRHRYDIDPVEHLRVQRDAEGRGMEIIGWVHSHPDNQARMSQFDSTHGWPFYSYVVASVVRGRLAQARSFKLDESSGQYREELLDVSGTEAIRSA